MIFLKCRPYSGAWEIGVGTSNLATPRTGHGLIFSTMVDVGDETTTGTRELFDIVCVCFLNHGDGMNEIFMDWWNIRGITRNHDISWTYHLDPFGGESPSKIGIQPPKNSDKMMEIFPEIGWNPQLFLGSHWGWFIGSHGSLWQSNSLWTGKSPCLSSENHL